MGRSPFRVPDEWKPRLRAHLRAACGEDRDHLSAYDFPGNQSIRVTFVDGSFAVFKFAFAVLDDAREHCTVFTEHCGYHVFPVGVDGVEVVRAVPPAGDQDAEPDAAGDGRGYAVT